MSANLKDLIQSEAYTTLASRRRRVSYSLTAINLLVYMAYVLSMGYARDWIAQPVGGSALSVGIILTIFVIIFSAALSWFYIWWTNSRFDPALHALLDEAGYGESQS